MPDKLIAAPIYLIKGLEINRVTLLTLCQYPNISVFIKIKISCITKGLFFFRKFNVDASESEKERESQLPVGRWNAKVGAIQLTRAIGHDK